MDFVETKVFYKNHVIDLNLKNENMSKNCPRKQKKCKNEQQHTKMFYIEKCLEMIFEKKIDTKKNLFLKHFTLKSTNKRVFSMENIWKIENGNL